MNRTRIIAALLSLALLVPTLASAQSSTNANARANAAASSTAQQRASAVRAVTSTSNSSSRVERAREKAQTEVQRRIDALQALITRLQESDRISEEFKNRLYDTVNEQIADLEDVQTHLSENTSTSTLRDDIRSVAYSYRVFALVLPQAQIAAAADRIVTMTATMSEIGSKLETRINKEADNGTDVSALEESLQNLASYIDSANTHARAAVTKTANLEPDNGDLTVAEANRAALEAAREELRLAHKDVQAGRDEIKTIIDGLKTLAPPTDTQTSTTTKSE